MGKYLFVYYGAWATTPAAQKKSMDAWTAWYGKLGKAVVEKGAPTMPGKIVRKSGIRAIGANPITGYSVFQADNLDAAVAMGRVFEFEVVARAAALSENAALDALDELRAARLIEPQGSGGLNYAFDHSLTMEVA